MLDLVGDFFDRTVCAWGLVDGGKPDRDYGGVAEDDRYSFDGKDYRQLPAGVPRLYPSNIRIFPMGSPKKNSWYEEELSAEISLWDD